MDLSVGHCDRCAIKLDFRRLVSHFLTSRLSVLVFLSLETLLWSSFEAVGYYGGIFFDSARFFFQIDLISFEFLRDLYGVARCETQPFRIGHSDLHTA